MISLPHGFASFSMYTLIGMSFPEQQNTDEMVEKKKLKKAEQDYKV